MQRALWERKRLAVYIYAADLLGRLKRVWKRTKLYVQEEEIPPLPHDRALRRLLDVAYHASLLTEERRRPSFRVVCCPQREFEQPERTRTGSGVHLTFASPVLFTEKQLLQLAPATDPTSVLIAVEPADGEDGELRIWGLLDTGSSWWAHTRSESERMVHAPPDFLMVSSSRPGQITISRGWRILMTLENGRLTSPPADVFLNGPVADDFLKPIDQLYEEVYASAGTDDPYEPLLNRHNCSVKYTTCIKRLLTYLMDKPHGGMLLILPEEVDGQECFEELLSIKYGCQHYELWSKLRRCLELRRRWFEIGTEIARGGEACDKAKVVELSRLRTAVEEQEHQLTDGLQLVAALSGVDGAVVLTGRLRLVGFGAELKAKARLSTIYKAKDSLALQREPVSPQSFGTRHRSAFRFCAEFGRGTAFVHSQDGGIKAVKKAGEDVVFWEVNPPND